VEALSHGSHSSTLSALIRTLLYAKPLGNPEPFDSPCLFLLQAMLSEVTGDDLQIFFVGHSVEVEVIPA
jgi:hypothetical protein